MGTDPEFTEEDGLVVAYDADMDVASQGETREEAAANLATALELHTMSAPGDTSLDDREVPVPDVDWF